MRVHFCYFALICLAHFGCATWDTPSDNKRLPAPQLAPDGVVLEVELVRVPAALASEAEQLWHEVDEQHLSTDLRRRFNANGVRTGLLGSQIPGILRDLLDAERTALEELVVDGSLPENSDVFSNYQRLQCRTGRRKKFVASPPLPHRTVVILNEQGQLQGETFEQSQGMFMVTTHPLGDGRVRVLLTPLIEHGQPQARWVPAPGTVTIQTRRMQRVYEQMQIDTVLSPGQTLVVTTTPEARGLGGLFFSDSVGPTDRSMLLIRLAQSQYDDLFSEQRTLTPLTTPVE